MREAPAIGPEDGKAAGRGGAGAWSIVQRTGIYWTIRHVQKECGSFVESGVSGQTDRSGHQKKRDGTRPARRNGGGTADAAASSSSLQGLTPDEVARSRELHGSNELTQKKRQSFFRQYLSSFGDPIIKILLAALAINVIFLFRHFDWYESAGIAIAVFLATFVSTPVGIRQRVRLRQASGGGGQKPVPRPPERSGVALPVGEIVVGDLIYLQAGERIPADGILISGRLALDQSALNGESREAVKEPGESGASGDLLSRSGLFGARSSVRGRHDAGAEGRGTPPSTEASPGRSRRRPGKAR